MIVYQATKQGFTDDVISNAIDDKILSAFQSNLGRTTSVNEINSWKNSMLYMNNVLSDEEIPKDAKVSIEFQIPLSSKRIDFIITGVDDSDGDNVVLVELKQWQTAQLTEKDGIVITRFQHGEIETTHPSYQAWSYQALMEGFNQTVYEDKIMIKSCAYLHNYEPDNVITNSFYDKYLKKAPVFLKPDALKLRTFIKKYIKKGDTSNIMYRIDQGKIKPSKQLADSLSSMLKGNQEFVMIDEQKIVMETAMKLAKRSDVTGVKNVLIVEGGPGTGKSVIAINLLVELTKAGKVCQYVTKNAAPRAVYASKLTGSIKKSHFHNLFRGSGSYIDSQENDFDVLIVDEAHRLNLKSGLYGNQGENQALEIMHAAKTAVFFVDDNQRIHIKDVGDKRRLQIWAEQEGAEVTFLKLSSQFRCNGSNGYLAWIDNVLEINETANYLLKKDEFDFRIFDNPSELRTVIYQKNRINNKSRMVAGYCWDWISKKKDPSAFDIQFPEYNFKMKWNLTKDGSNWLIAKNSINEIGCIHTSQGLELDYVGVIVGKDLRYVDGQLITDITQRSSMDQSIRGIKKMLKQESEKAEQLASQIIKNTYRTLMTRGMKGCYVFFEDEELKNYFKRHMEPAKGKVVYLSEPDTLGMAAEPEEEYGSGE